MSLADAFGHEERRATTPPEFQPRLDVDGDEGTVQVLGGTTFGDALREHGLDPEHFEVVGTPRISRWQLFDGTWANATRFHFRQRTTSLDLVALYRAARKPPKPLKPSGQGRVTHVVFADPQVGKVGARGGTPALLERLACKRADLDAWMRANRSERSYFWDPGDGPEGIENVSSQLATNDLSLVQQVDVLATEIYEFHRIMLKHGPLESVTVPSNHAQLRRGKGLLGKPTDDWGIFAHEQVAKIHAATGTPFTLHRPGEWDEAVAIDCGSAKIGMVHGHQGRSQDRMSDFWRSHTHGAGVLHDIDVLIHGHWHVGRLSFTGRSPRTGKSKVLIGAPTLDNGSDWFRNMTGEDSDPGLIVFQTDELGFNLQSFTIL